MGGQNNEKGWCTINHPCHYQHQLVVDDEVQANPSAPITYDSILHREERFALEIEPLWKSITKENSNEENIFYAH